MARVVKLRHAMAMNAFFMLAGCMLALNFVDVEQHARVQVIRAPLESSRNLAKVALVVFSAPANERRRTVIRDTWLKLASLDDSSAVTFRHYFAVGVAGVDRETLDALEREQVSNDDLLLLPDLADSYEALTLKLLHSVKWVRAKFPNLRFFVKCDDDSFVRLNVLLEELRSRPDLAGDYVYWGYFKGNARVRRDGRWAEPDWFLCDRYLPYALGGGYALSAKIVDFVAKNSHLLRAYKSEDASLGVWTAPLSDVRRVHDKRFDTEWTTRGCEDSLVVRHKQSPEDMVRMYKTLTQSNGTKLCKSVYSTRAAYEYDWKALPGSCCSSL